MGTENLKRDLVSILLVFGLVFSITLDCAVTVTNTGQAADIYNLWTSASTGWFPHIEPSSLTLDPGESDNATLSLIVPSDASEGDTGIMEVRAISTTDPVIHDHDICRVVVELTEDGGIVSDLLPRVDLGASTFWLCHASSQRAQVRSRYRKLARLRILNVNTFRPVFSTGARWRC